MPSWVHRQSTVRDGTKVPWQSSRAVASRRSSRADIVQTAAPHLESQPDPAYLRRVPARLHPANRDATESPPQFETPPYAPDSATSLAPEKSSQSRARESREYPRPPRPDPSNKSRGLHGAKTISPATIRPGDDTKRNVEKAVTLFPHPLSPTIPTVLPRGISIVTPSTARTVPSSRKKCVFKLFMVNTLSKSHGPFCPRYKRLCTLLQPPGAIHQHHLHPGSGEFLDIV